MTATAIRKKLITYIADADDKKVKDFYKLLEDEIDKKENFTLSEPHLKIVEKEKELHLQGKSKSYSRSESNEIIRGKKKL